MNNVDIGLFDYDRHNAVYYFAMNVDEQIYLRYGGRDQGSAMSYLDLDSIEVALKQGLELHQCYLRGELAAPERPAPLFPREIPALYDQTIGRGRCVECHLIGDLQNVQRQRDGVLDKISQMYRSPNIKAIWIHNALSTQYEDGSWGRFDPFIPLPDGRSVGLYAGKLIRTRRPVGDFRSTVTGIRVMTLWLSRSGSTPD